MRAGAPALLVLALCFGSAAGAQSIPVSDDFGCSPNRACTGSNSSASAAAPAGPAVFSLLAGSIAAASECTGTALTDSNGSVAITVARTGGTATCLKTDGTLVTMAADTPRLEGNGLVEEGAATNIALQSEVFDNASWTKAAGTTVTANQVAGPDGNVTMDLLTKVSDATGSAFQARTFGAAQTVATASVWTRAVSATSIQSVGIACAGTLTSVDSCTRSDGGACTIGNSGTNAFAYATMGTTPVRLQVRVTCSSSTTFYIFATPGRVFTDTTGTGYFVGAQLEAGPVATSYVATTTVAITRAAESISFTTPASIVDGAGCVSAVVRVKSVTAGARVLSFGSAGTPLYLQSSTVARQDDQTNTTSATAGSSILDRAVTVRSGWTTSGHASLVVNDGVSATGTYDDTMVGATAYIGSTAGTSNHLNGWIKSLVLDTSSAGCQ